jgi:hypothetical protein
MSISKLTKAERAQLKSISGAGDGKFSDYDGDGYPDQFDCDPLDPNKDGILGDAWARISGASSRAQAAARRIYRPAAVSAREAVSTVFRRAYGADAAARSRISRTREFARKPARVRAERIESGKKAFVKKYAPSGTISPISKRIHEESARVAWVARGFEGKIDPRVRDIERALGFHSKAIPKPVRWTGEQAKQIGYGVAFSGPAAAVEMAGMVPGGVETIARKPSIVPAAATLGLFEMGRGMWHGVTTSPARTVGEFITMGAISKGVPRIPVSAKVSRALPSLPAEAKAPPGLPPGKQLKFEAGLELAQKLAKTEAPIKRPLDFTEITALPKGSGRGVETWIKTHPKQEAVIFGSASVRTQLKTSRKPGDLDVFVKDPSAASKQVHAIIAKEIGAQNVRLGGPRGVTVETRIGGKWDHAVDFHARSEMTGRMTLGFETQKPIEIGGIKYTTVGEQLTRKAASVLQQKGKTIGPPEHRAAKDIGDFMDISGQMIESRAKAAESSWLLSGYKTRKAAHLTEMRHQYEMHSYLGPEIAPAVRGYYGIPSTIRAPGYMVAAIGIGAKYPGVAKYPPAKEYPPSAYPAAKYHGVVKYPGAGEYPPSAYPAAKHHGVVKYPGVGEYPPTRDKYPPSHVPYPPAYPTTTTTKYPPPATSYPPAYPTLHMVPTVAPPLEPSQKPASKIPPRKKDKKKVKPPKAKPEMAVGWKQRHRLITLESLLGYKT